jgi:hypothetical protein
MIRPAASTWFGPFAALFAAALLSTGCSTEGNDADLDDENADSVDSDVRGGGGGKRKDSGAGVLVDSGATLDAGGGTTTDGGGGAGTGDPNVASQAARPFAAGKYIANGTVFTRTVASMPLATNSAAIAAYSVTMPSKFRPQPDQFPWLVTSINTHHYNIPIYVVDSTNPAQPKAKFTSTDPRVTSHADLVEKTTGSIPLPTYGVPDSIGDRALAIYDRGTGLMREYFYVVPQADGSWTFRASGYYQAGPGFTGLPTNNFWMQLTKGSSAVVGMLNPLSQIGLDELRAGVIQHAVSVTLPNAKRGVTSFPARFNDGTDDHPDAPAEGQWFRIDPSVNLDALGLKPLTLVIAKAVQKYGGYGADKNLWCFAFNAEHPINEMAAGKVDPWATGGDLKTKYGAADVNDFPWKHVQWATVGWNGK